MKIVVQTDEPFSYVTGEEVYKWNKVKVTLGGINISAQVAVLVGIVHQHDDITIGTYYDPVEECMRVQGCESFCLEDYCCILEDIFKIKIECQDADWGI